MRLAVRSEPEPRRSHCYDFFGVRLALSGALPHVLDGVDATFSAFRVSGLDRPPDLDLRVETVDGQVIVDEWPAGSRWVEPPEAILPALLGRLNDVVLESLARRDVLVVHAAAVECDGAALILAGPSGRGKSTLALGLVRAGLRLLSDELALIDSDGVVHAYARSLHLRPGTPELAPELGRLGELQSFGGGIRWAVSRRRLQQAFPGCLASAAPLRGVLLLDQIVDGAPRLAAARPAAVAVELLESAPLAAHALPHALRRLGPALSDARCGRLTAGEPERTVQLVASWFRNGAVRSGTP